METTHTTEDFRDRVVEEFNDITSKLRKLQAFTFSSAFATIPEKHRQALLHQEWAMGIYRDAINTRISMFTKDDPDWTPKDLAR